MRLGSLPVVRSSSFDDHPRALTGDIDASVGQAFGYGLLWALDRLADGDACSPPRRPPRRPGPARPRAPSPGWPCYKPLGLVLLVTTAIGTAVWIVEVATDGTPRDPLAADRADRHDAVRRRPRRAHARARLARRFERRGLRAGGAEPAAAGRGARRRHLQRRDLPPLRLPRRRQRDRLPADARLLDRVARCGALLAGFTVARERAASTPVLAAAWGALVGPVGRSRSRSSSPAPGHAVRPRPGRERVRDRARPRRADRRAGLLAAAPSARADYRRRPRAARRRAEPDEPPTASPSTTAIPSSPDRRRRRRPSPARPVGSPAGWGRGGRGRRRLARHLELDLGVELLRHVGCRPRARPRR